MPTLLLGNVPPKKIVVQTAAGREIENTQEMEIDEVELNKLPLFHQKYGPGLVVRTPPTGRYNCHGLTFASRRTWVFGDGNTLQHIIEDDRYSEVLPNDVLPGDTVLYFDERGVPWHSGIVVEVPKDPPIVPLVCSKWAHSAEFLHRVTQGPYGLNFKYFRVTP